MKKTLFILLSFSLLVSCSDMDIQPKNIVSDDMLMSNTSGMEIYMADLYRRLPVEDFKYQPNHGLDGFCWLCCLGVEGTGEAVGRDFPCAFTHEDYSYWSEGFVLVRQCNKLIENLPKYKDSYSESIYNEYIGQAYFVRAYTFFQMARRYGGIPLPTTTIPYSKDNVVELYRSSEEDTWNQILSDIDMAVSLLPETATLDDSANKYIALAVKADAMLYAGSIAKYNKNTNQDHLSYIGRKSKNRVMGFDLGKEDELSVKWLSESYKASREIMKSGKYSLYKKKWVEGHDENAQYQQYRNMVEMLSDLTSPENIFVVEYSFPKKGHCLDSQSSPYYYMGSGSAMSSQTCIPMDFIELFEGFNRYPNGHIKLTTGNSFSEGDYLMWSTPTEFYKNAEPRLRSYCIFPMAPFRKDLATVDIRLGVYTGDVPVKPFFTNYGYDSYASNRYQNLGLYTSKTDKTLYMSASNSQTETVEVPEGVTPKNIATYEDQGKQVIAATALNGPFYNMVQTAETGVLLRKYLNENITRDDIHDGYSDQPFILYRYAEILLDAAEAGVELSIAGVQCPVEGDDMLQVATDAVKEIQERAGVIDELDHKLSGTDQDRNYVRKERRKELAFEHKTKWDLRRWRVQHADQRNLFWGEERGTANGYFPLSEWSLNDSYRLRSIIPVYSLKADSYFFDPSFEYIGIGAGYSFTYNDYYFTIPTNEVAKSNYIDQQPNKE